MADKPVFIDQSMIDENDLIITRQAIKEIERRGALEKAVAEARRVSMQMDPASYEQLDLMEESLAGFDPSNPQSDFMHFPRTPRSTADLTPGGAWDLPEGIEKRTYFRGMKPYGADPSPQQIYVPGPKQLQEIEAGSDIATPRPGYPDIEQETNQQYITWLIGQLSGDRSA